jgi:hypothetical protein
VLNVWTRVVDGVARAMGVRNFCGVTVLPSPKARASFPQQAVDFETEQDFRSHWGRLHLASPHNFPHGVRTPETALISHVEVYE